MIKRKPKPFYVINWMHGEQPEQYDVMQFLIAWYRNLKKSDKEKLETIDDIKEFITHNSYIQWCGKCEYTFVIIDWPCQQKRSEWDVYKQIKMNFDVITDLFIENIGWQPKKNNKQIIKYNGNKT